MDRLVLGQSYETIGGDTVTMISVHREGSHYETMADQHGVHRYSYREYDIGRCTGREPDHPKNIRRG